MKKLLTILGSVGLIATTSAAVVACGDRTSKTSEPKKEEENRTEESKKDKEEKGKEEKETEPDFSNIEKEIFNFEPDENNIIPQLKIKEELAKKLNVVPSDLQELKVDYEKNTISVFIPKFKKTLNLKFTKILDLGQIETEKRNNVSVVSQTKIKDALAKRLKTDSSKLQGLTVDYEKNTGNVRGPKSSNPIEFKFTVKETK
ncbi:lipoprotein [Mycoplasma feriruminatoris]|uniref:Lipoprotein n=1 Tax=Mycoplasma feriruminatoris TaxID=1179777 RepID=A0AAQ3DQR6_9MOLU|nr:lipoprotein [Mycoplasma feriruminatoris]WFQ95591.1 hypothetical protein MFERI15407_00853 [Mycoplasma feriruminatoris]